MKFGKEPHSFGYGIILTLLAYFIFSCTSAFVRIMGKDFPTIQIIFFQSIIPLLCLLPRIFSQKIALLKPVAILPHIIRDLGGVGSFFTYFLAIKYLGLIDATVLSYTGPFYIPIIWSLWTKEKFSPKIWWAIMLGFIGVLCILRPGSSIFCFSCYLGIISGIFSAFALVAIGILNRKKEVLTNILVYNFLVATLISLPFTIISWKNPTSLQWTLLLAIGFLTFIAQIVLTEGYKHGAASYLSPMTYSIVIYTSFISWLFFASPPSWLTMLGITCIIIGGTLSFILGKKPETISEVFKANNIVKKKPWWRFWNDKS